MGDDDSAIAADAAVEVCDNGIDDDLDGGIDNGCTCYPGKVQPCFIGNPASAGVGVCMSGLQTCAGDGETGTWGACEGAVGPDSELCNEIDDDCNGIVDDLGGGATCTIIDVAVNIDGDCVTAHCPAMAPFPIGCTITMQGNDSRGCVASMPQSPDVYFQEGDKCGVGHVSGTLKCATSPGSPLDAMSCTINKSTKLYTPTPAGCPAT